MMNLRLGILIVISIFAVLLTILALDGLVGGEWTEISQAVASVIIMIAFLSLVIAVVVGKG